MVWRLEVWILPISAWDWNAHFVANVLTFTSLLRSRGQDSEVFRSQLTTHRLLNTQLADSRLAGIKVLHSNS
jgi:hypothetical protein